MAKGSKIDRYIALLDAAGEEGVTKATLTGEFGEKPTTLYGLANQSRKKGKKEGFTIDFNSHSDAYSIKRKSSALTPAKTASELLAQNNAKRSYNSPNRNMQAMCKDACNLPPEEQEIFASYLRKSMACHGAANAMVEAGKAVDILMRGE